MGFIIIILIILFAFIFPGIRIVSESNTYVIERLGKFHNTLDAGIHIIIPYIDRVAKKVSLKEQVADFPPQPVITKDNVTMQIDTVVYYKVMDAQLYTYGVSNPIFAIENLTATTLRNIIGELELDDTLTSRDTINSKMREILDEATDPWGIKISRVELKNIMPPKEIQMSMEKQMKAERERRETLLEAEGHKQAIVTREEGNKQAKILEAEGNREAAIADAEGRARAIELVYEAEARGLQKISDVLGTNGVIVLKKLESLEKVSDGRATKIVVPTDLATSASNLTYIEEMLNLPGSEPIDKSAKPKKPNKKDDCCNDKDIKKQPSLSKTELTADEKNAMVLKLSAETGKPVEICRQVLEYHKYDYDETISVIKI